MLTSSSVCSWTPPIRTPTALYRATAAAEEEEEHCEEEEPVPGGVKAKEGRGRRVGAGGQEVVEEERDPMQTWVGLT